tara:strand:- start:450 stop:875 length:426 start_codon:yes stop_codon:yes gene_type:complete
MFVKIKPSNIILQTFKNYYKVDNYIINSNFLIKGVWYKFNMCYTNYILNDQFKKIFEYTTYSIYTNIYAKNLYYVEFILIDNTNKNIFYSRFNLQSSSNTKLYTHNTNNTIYFKFITKYDSGIISFNFTDFDIEPSIFFKN